MSVILWWAQLGANDGYSRPAAMDKSPTLTGYLEGAPVSYRRLMMPLSAMVIWLTLFRRI
jgi:hypothetical protein